MEQGIKRTQRDYTLAFKLSVVEQVEKGDLTYKEAHWVDPSGRARSGSIMPKQDSRPLTPEQRIKQLETQLREAQEKAALFEAVIDVMRQDYGVTVKKPSGRSSRKGGSKS